MWKVLTVLLIPNFRQDSSPRKSDLNILGCLLPLLNSFLTLKTALGPRFGVVSTSVEEEISPRRYQNPTDDCEVLHKGTAQGGHLETLGEESEHLNFAVAIPAECKLQNNWGLEMLIAI